MDENNQPTRAADLEAIEQALAVCDTLLCHSNAPDLSQKRRDWEAGRAALVRLAASQPQLVTHHLAALCAQAFREIYALVDLEKVPHGMTTDAAVNMRYRIEQACGVALKALEGAEPVRILVDVEDGHVEVSCNYQAELIKLDYDCDGDTSEDVRLLGTDGRAPDSRARGCYITDDIIDPTPEDIAFDFARARSSTPRWPQGEA